jgi:spore coat polysaccharide biosynthesis protein SpsF (cytidylyltransferase family)
MDLCGKPVLQRVLERAGKSRKVDEVMVITSIEKENLPILKLCANLGIRVGVGSEDDVLDRYYQTARLLRPEYIIRITADCPCFDSGILDEAVKTMKEDADYLGMISETFADGLDLEIFRYRALERSWKEARHSFEREHVTQYIKGHPELFRIQDFRSPIEGFGAHRWTVDGPKDLEMIRKIYEYFIQGDKKEDFGYRDILKYLKDHPEISDINKGYQRNEGLRRSIKEDRLVPFETEG